MVSRSSIGEKDFEMRSYKIREYDRKRTFYMAYRKKIYLSPVAEAFRDYVLRRKEENAE